MGKKKAAAVAAEKDWRLVKGLVSGGDMSRSNSRGLVQKPSTRRGERKISRNSLTCVPEVEQMIVDNNGKGSLPRDIV